MTIKKYDIQDVPVAKDPKLIYREVQGEMDAILQVFQMPASNDDLSNAIRTARDSFLKLKEVTDVTLMELEKNAEWDALTVAFYGETNAGKSTIIETLRILMGEKTKLEQQKKFREMRDSLAIDSELIAQRDLKIKEIGHFNENLEKLEWKFSEDRKDKIERRESLSNQVNKLGLIISALPFWRRWLFFIWKIPEMAIFLEKRTELRVAASEEKNLLKEHEKQKTILSREIEKLQKNIFRIEEAMRELEVYEDGSIIGDGRSDFTRESTPYEFDINGNRLVLLDVPGIEGKEELVREPIMQAVRKAHAVFYVTCKAVPPQKGDDEKGSKGTLEKIKEHLGAQAEVWVIFNKRINSGEQLRLCDKQLVNEGERGGLNVLEDEMRKQLGAHYAGLLSVSAQAAFVASTDNFSPTNTRFKIREKFLRLMDANSIHQKTGFHDLISRLGSEMTENSKSKIRKSNFNKANEAVLNLKREVDSLNKNEFSPLFDRLDDASEKAIKQMDAAANGFRVYVESDASELFNKIKRKERERIYEKINGDIGSDELKACLKRSIDSSAKEIETGLPKILKGRTQEFSDEIKGIAEHFKEHVQMAIDDAAKISFLDPDFKINIDSGIKVGAFVSSSIGIGLGIYALVNIWNPTGWTAAMVIAAMGIVAAFVSLVKSVWGFFDSDYKKSQQKKSADEALEKFFGDVRSGFNINTEEGFSKLTEIVNEIKAGFTLPALQAERIMLSLSDSSQKLLKVSKKIVIEGAL